MSHHLDCGAPICAADPNPNYKHEVVWGAGETVCQKTPYQKFQKIQKLINADFASGKFRKVDEMYNAHDLETKSI